MFDKMKNLMEMKKQADQVKRELDQLTVEVNAVNGIKIVVTGSQNFQSLNIDEALVNPDGKEKLETNLLNSINEAIKRSQDLAAQKMKDVMQGFSGA